jgi:hypothetical protein
MELPFLRGTKGRVLRLLESFLADVLQCATIREACVKDGAPHCRFEIAGAGL